MSANTEAILSAYKGATVRAANYLKVTQDITLKPAHVLELVARVLNTPNWQTLHGMAKAGQVPSLASSTNSPPSAVQSQLPAVEAIKYALRDEDAQSFLKCWLHGDLDAIRREWPDAPESCIVRDDAHLEQPSEPEHTTNFVGLNKIAAHSPTTAPKAFSRESSGELYPLA